MATKFKRVILNPKEVVSGFHIAQVQDNLDLTISEIQNSQFQNGVFVDASLLSASDNTINHGLGRKVTGWVVVDKNANANVWQSTAVNNFPDKQLILKTSVNVTAKIYIF